MLMEQNAITKASESLTFLFSVLRFFKMLLTSPICVVSSVVFFVFRSILCHSFIVIILDFLEGTKINVCVQAVMLNWKSIPTFFPLRCLSVSCHFNNSIYSNNIYLNVLFHFSFAPNYLTFCTKKFNPYIVKFLKCIIMSRKNSSY